MEIRSKQLPTDLTSSHTKIHRSSVTVRSSLPVPSPLSLTASTDDNVPLVNHGLRISNSSRISGKARETADSSVDSGMSSMETNGANVRC